MHLLAALPGLVSDGAEPVDPDQSPAELIFLSAADTELAAMAAANSAAGNGPDFLRLAQLSWLSHPYSVDLYIDKTASRAKLVVIRALGGFPYWQYCMEQFSARLRETGCLFAALPGDDNKDQDLLDLSSVGRDDWHLLHRYCVEGGPANAGRFLQFCRHLTRGEPKPLPPTPLLKAGLYSPSVAEPDLETLRGSWSERGRVAAIVLYRAWLQGGNTEPVDWLIRALEDRGMNPLPVFVSSLKDPVSEETVDRIFGAARPDIVLNLTGFAVGSPAESGSGRRATVLDRPGRPVLQVMLASAGEETWLEGDSGVPARDIAMNVSLPEVDGRLTTRAVAFKSQSGMDETTQCPIAGHRARQDRIDFVADLAANWVRLAETPINRRRIAIVLANYPNRDGRIANGVGLDTPASTVRLLTALRSSGHEMHGAPETTAELMDLILSGPTNRRSLPATGRGNFLTLTDYLDAWQLLPCEVRKSVRERWGEPEDDPAFQADRFTIAAHVLGNAAVAVQPARGYNIDPVDTYHSPDLVPPHGYFAFYFWLRHHFGAHAVVHLGKHGNLEWLPGKAVALSEGCMPEAALGPMPNICPFIVNDPGEGTQAKRRSQAVIIDHLTPPLTRAESHGLHAELESLIDEYHEAAGVDPRRIGSLRSQILKAMETSQMDIDAGIGGTDDADARLRKLDAYLCELKEAQIRDGLHVFGEAPEGRLLRDLALALVRCPRGDGLGGNASLVRAMAADLDLDGGFDPLDCEMSNEWNGTRPKALASVSGDAWRTAGDTVERLELLAIELADGLADPPGPASLAVLGELRNSIIPAVEACGGAELTAITDALEGNFVEPGPSGAPTRGRPDVLPTGRNFYSVDSRALPTRTAWDLGWKSAYSVIERHVQDHGEWPRRIAVTAWGTSNMRTGGDDVAQVLAFMGVRPAWDAASGRVTGFEVIPSSALGRPRIDVTLRVSGFFRDAFPMQMDLVASAARAVMELDEPEEDNPAAASFRAEAATVGAERAAYRVFGSKPGAYGAGLQALIDESIWRETDDFGDAYLEWGGYAYGSGADGSAAREDFSVRLRQVEAVVQNQDNREHDVLDSDDYYQFEGGISAAVAKLSGNRPTAYHNDHSRPERPRVRTLEEEIGRVVRSRAINPKWINGVMRHGYKGAFEIAATVDYLFAFAATTGAARSHHFDLVYGAYIDDESTRSFIAESNPPALREIAARLAEAIERNLWQPRLNSARGMLQDLIDDAQQ